MGQWPGIFVKQQTAGFLSRLAHDRSGNTLMIVAVSLVPILAMAISTVAEGYRWTTLAVAGGMLALIGLFIALRSGRVAPPAPAD